MAKDEVFLPIPKPFHAEGGVEKSEGRCRSVKKQLGEKPGDSLLKGGARTIQDCVQFTFW